MANIILKPSWQGNERDVTPEDLYWNRRQFLRMMGCAGLGVLTAGALPACSSASSEPPGPGAFVSPQPALPVAAVRNEAFVVPERPLTPYRSAANYNNFYEFTTDKERVAKMAQQLTTEPWTLEVSGLVEKPQTFDVDQLLKQFPLEERIYRFRCVEAWAMTVPWVGFPLATLLKEVVPLSKARFVRFVTVLRPEEMPGQARQDWYPWPYFEGLRLDEALNPLALLAVGMYGKVLPKQNGAPIRLVTPWKYGYKSPKSIVKIELTEDQPETFWNKLQPREYGFYSNVDPGVPHPRWSQASERLISTGERVPTKLYNGYAEQVASLYADGEYF